MSVSYPAIFNTHDFALRNLWEADLYSHDDSQLALPKGLISSINIPKMSFEVSDIMGGASKAYTGWKLPDNIKLTIWETADHLVERYLDGWMTGPNGVFNLNAGRLRAGRVRNLYRRLDIKTFRYEVESTQSAEVNRWEINHSMRREALKREFKKHETFKVLTRKQVLPLLDKFMALGGSLINQQTTKVPVSADIKSQIVPPVVFPPVLLRIPVTTGRFAENTGRRIMSVTLQNVHESNSSTGKSNTGKDSVHGGYIQQDTVTIGPDYSQTKFKNDSSSGIVTSHISYFVAIVGYDVGSYDYTKGDGVSYDVDLAVVDIRINPVNGSYSNSPDVEGSIGESTPS